MQATRLSILFCIGSLLFAKFAYTQSYMNEWIDNSKTYYRFKVGAKGIYRISKNQLTALGIEATDATHFQLWNKGQEVPIYTSVANGTLPDDGFIEFWGQTNDGSWESRLYIRPEFQINSEYSLFTDTSIYFLTINKQGNNKRLDNVSNNVTSILETEQFFMHRTVLSFRNQYSQGFAAVVGSEVFSSSYDNGEGFVSANISPSSTFSNNLNNLFVATSSGVNAGIRYTAAGRSLNIRNINISVNNTVLEEREMNYYNSINTGTYLPVSLSILSSNSAKIDIRNLSNISNDRMVVGILDLKYPRLFNFGGQSYFEFELPANTSGNKLVIENFDFAGIAPILYDLTNGFRITAQITTENKLLIILPPSAVSRKLVLTSVAPERLRTITEITPRTFIDYRQAQYQGNYIIISNPLIYNDKSGINQVDAYGQYRMSNAGGNYKVIIADINQLIDQFGWGIKNNPLSIRNFLRFARTHFMDKEQYCLLVGKGVASNLARINESLQAVNSLNLIPTFGVPCSDVMLASEEGDVVPRTHIGRLNVVNADELREYLEKLKLYEDKQLNKTCSIGDEIWKKQIMHIGGANDFLGEQIMYYLKEYEKILKGPLRGANIATFQKSESTNIQVMTIEKIRQLFTDGFALLTYFGNSSVGNLDFNLDNPNNYSNSGKFPVFLVNGSSAGNLFLLDTLRMSKNYVLSEKYVLSTPQKGAIAFIASTHLGIVNYLNIYTEEFYNQLGKTSYGKSLGVNISSLTDSLITRYTINDFFVRQHVEQITLHGDPALVMYHSEKPDYAIDSTCVKFTPEIITIAENKYAAKIKIFNIGRANTDSLFVSIKKTNPNQNIDTLFYINVKSIPNADSIELLIDVNPTQDTGRNLLQIILDPQNLIDEMCENNNMITREFYITDDEIRPVYPYNQSIISNSTIKFFGSTINPLKSERSYFFEIDTTAFFNSPLLKQQTITSKGGLLEFQPSNYSYLNNKAYYWRLGTTTANQLVKWKQHSFIFRPDLEDGYNQSHYFQYANNNYNDLILDSKSRNFEFKKIKRKLRIKNGLFPYYDFSTNEVYLDLQKVDGWRCNQNVFSIYVFENNSLKSWRNTREGSTGKYGSLNPLCINGIDRYFFEFDMKDISGRNNARIFLENIIPDSTLVLILNQGTARSSFFPANNSFISQWMSDTAVYGTQNSIYHTLKKNGFTQIDSFTRNLPFAFFYKKGDPQFARQFIGEKENDFIDVTIDIPGRLNSGEMESPWMGPMKKWDNFYWDGSYSDGISTTDSVSFQLIGKKYDGTEQVFSNQFNSNSNSISFINAQEFPYLKMKMFTQDSINLTPIQLNYWRLTGTQVPEGGIAPNILFISSDTVQAGDSLFFAVAFKNASKFAFDSIALKLILINPFNNQFEIPTIKKRPIISGDTIIVYHQINTNDLKGLNSIFLMVNPDDSQPEQYLFNNIISKNFYVKERIPLSTTDRISTPQNDWIFYPNPASTGSIYIHFKDPVNSSESFKIIDINGQIRKEFITPKGTNYIQIQTSDLTNGIYFIKRSKGNNYNYKKLLIIHQ